MHDTTKDVKVGDWKVRPAELAISDGVTTHTLEAKIMDVLLALASRPGDVVSRNDLIDEVWGTEFGGDESLTRAISLLRKTLGDTRGNHRHIVTVPRRGYQLIADVVLADDEPQNFAASQEPAAPAAPISASMENNEATAVDRERHIPFPILGLGAIVIIAAIFGIVRLFAPSQPDSVIASAALYDSGYYLVDQISVSNDNPESQSIAQDLTREVIEFMSNAGLQVGRRSVGDDTQSPEFILQGELNEKDVQFTLTRWDGGAPYWTQSFEHQELSIQDIAVWAAVKPASIAACIEDIRSWEKEENDDLLRHIATFCAVYFDFNFLQLVSVSEDMLREHPESLIAKALTANAHGIALWYDQQTESDKRASEIRLNELATSVLDKDPENSAVRLGLALSHRHSDFARMLEELEIGYRAGMFDTIRLRMLGLTLRVVGQNKQAIEATRLAAAHPHFSPGAAWLLPYLELVFYFNVGSIEDLKLAERRAGPVGSGGYVNQVYLHYVPLDQALAHFESTKSYLYTDCTTAFLHARSGGDVGLNEVFALCNDAPVDPSAKHRMFAQLGLLDAAFEASREAIATHSDNPNHWPTFFHFPEYAAFRADPRFWEIADGFGMIDIWLETGRWPDWCFEPDLGYNCEARARAYKASAPTVE